MALFSILQSSISRFQGFADIAQTAAVKADKVVRKLSRDNPSGIVVGESNGAPAGAKASAANARGFSGDTGQATPIGLTGSLEKKRKESSDTANIFAGNKTILIIGASVIVILGAVLLMKGK